MSTDNTWSVEDILKRYPCLTEEEAEELAEAINHFRPKRKFEVKDLSEAAKQGVEELWG